MKIGVFGGTFDPVHVGHMRLADACRKQLRLDRVRFVPAAQQPHKADAPAASGPDRTAMLRLATRDEPAFEVSTAEIDRGGASYTVDTLRQFAASEPDAELYFLMGADSLADLPRWREAAEICRLAVPAVVLRAGQPPPDFEALRPVVDAARLDELRAAQVQMPATPISSSEIRRLVAEGGDWRRLVPAAVADYIDEHSLYTRLEALQPPEQLEER